MRGGVNCGIEVIDLVLPDGLLRDFLSKGVDIGREVLQGLFGCALDNAGHFVLHLLPPDTLTFFVALHANLVFDHADQLNGQWEHSVGDGGDLSHADGGLGTLGFLARVLHGRTGFPDAVHRFERLHCFATERFELRRETSR